MCAPGGSDGWLGRTWRLKVNRQRYRQPTDTQAIWNCSILKPPLLL
ncbi:hypothetical protein CGMCC3_g8424 [Colletotrichum fructicola]|nr:uncharacterized protein CGMCC3_g8424 [Colletotrichum fructicola]KAE9575618.1 hypothetical protein CGMCC3_g8424 [Colletotrichum fructicola]